MSHEENGLSTRVFLRPIGVPLPLGMAGLAIASLVNSGFELHWIKQSQAADIGWILVTVPFILQLIACVLSYLARDGAVGATLGILATTWFAVGIIHIVSPHSQVSGAMGLLLLAAGGFLALSAMSVAMAKPLPALVFLAAAIRFVLAGVYQLSTTSSWAHASGILGLVITGVAMYCALAFELEGQNHDSVLPTFRRGRGAQAIRADSRVQVNRVEHEAGVRQTS